MSEADPRIHTVRVDLAGRSYPIEIGAGLLDGAGHRLASHFPRRRTVIVTDAAVDALWGERLRASLSVAGIGADTVVLPPGEATKSFTVLEAVISRLLAARIERTDAIIALGGGVIGDLTGFAAAILRRGCPFIQVPTTLLAQVDSSVGGKTAINTPEGKNLIGSFHQPVHVLIDTDVLTTLPHRERLAGYAEVVKYGLINDAAFFDWLEAHGDAVLAGEPGAQRHAIATSVAAKAAIVAQDEFETNGIRALLNLGHTFGHALEAETGYSDRLLHGEAVAIGMVLAAQFSAHIGLCDRAVPARIERHLLAVGLRTTLGQTGITGPAARLIDHMRQDKKRTAGTLPFLLMRGIGETFLALDVDLTMVEQFLDERMSRP
jgi:3-dehydroquinate synthase